MDNPENIVIHFKFQSVIIDKLPQHQLVPNTGYLECLTYKPGQSYDFIYKQLLTLRALGYSLPIILYTFERPESVSKKLNKLESIYIIRLPIDTESLQILINAWKVDTASIAIEIEKSQEAYMDETLLLLKHGNELDLLNTTLNPLRAMSINVLTGISTMEKWNTLRTAILHKLQNNPEYTELFLITERLNNPNQKHYPVKLFFNKLLLSLNKQTDISEMKSFITNIDALIFDFDSLFR